MAIEVNKGETSPADKQGCSKYSRRSRRQIDPVSMATSTQTLPFASGRRSASGRWEGESPGDWIELLRRDWKWCQPVPAPFHLLTRTRTTIDGEEWACMCYYPESKTIFHRRRDRACEMGDLTGCEPSKEPPWSIWSIKGGWRFDLFFIRQKFNPLGMHLSKI